MKLKKIANLLLAVASACTSLPTLAQASQPSLVVNRIVAPVDEANLVSLKGNVHPLAQARFDRGPAPGSTPTGRLTLVLQPSAAQQQALTQYLADLQNASSPSFHKWLTPAQFGALYGISDADLQTVEGWLESHGFRIDKVPAARNLIQFSGTFDEVQNAFHTSIHSFAVNGESHVANVSDPEIPEALAPVVAGITALNDFRPKPMVKMGPKGHFDESSKRIVPDLTLSGSLYVDPADAATIYDTPNKNLNTNYSGTTYDGTGVKIGIAGDSNINMPDITNYRTGFLGLSSSSANDPTVVIDGSDPGPTGTSDEIEALLDNEIAGGMAPGAKIYFYTSADSDLSSGLFNAILRAIDDNAVSILNISFGACEAAEGSNGNAYLNAVFEQAAAQGISVTVSTGDSGSAGCDSSSATSATQGFGINAFASTPWTIAVGGTDYDTLATSLGSYVSSGQGSAPYYRTANKYIPENPWNDSTDNNTTYSANIADTSQGATNIVAAGGGKSIYYSKPSFQSSVTPSDGARDIPDVSFLAANGFYNAAWALCGDSQAYGETGSPTVDCQNNSGVFVSGTTINGVGGTSAAAPAFAGMLALVAQAHGSASDNYRLGQADYILYQLAKSKYSTVFHDVTTGNNSVVCTAGSTNCGSNHFLTGYNAGTAYDYASGLGSVDVSALVSNWTNASLTGTTTSLEINNSTAAINVAHGTALTFKVGVTPTSATGSVAIIDTANETSGGTGSGPQNNGQFAITLSSGSGSATYNGLPGGSYSVMARYDGDASNAVSTSSPISVTISKENSSTALQVNAYRAISGSQISTTSIPYGSQINLDATISGTSSDEVTNGTEGTATGSVTFKNNSTTLGSAPVTSQGNEASWPPISSQFTVLPAGSYSATAAYSGDPSFNASTSPATAFTIAKATTTTAASANPTTVSATGTSTVTVTITTPFNYGAAGYGSVPTGTVTLTVNGTTLGTISSLPNPAQSGNNFVSTATATIQGSQLPSGSDTITATYSGDPNYAGSHVNFTVTGSGSGTGGGAAIGLSNSGNITVSPGATTGNTSTITVTPSGGFTGAVNLTCAVTTTITNPTDPPTCSLGTGSSVTISGTKASTATLTVSTTAASSSALEKPLKKFFIPSGGAALAMVLLFGIPARRRAWRTLFSLLAVIVVISAIGCGGSSGTKTSNPGTTAGAYTVTVTGTDAATGKITSNTAVSLTVN